MYIEARINPDLDEWGNVVSLTMIARDVTEERNIKEALMESEEKYRVLFDTFPLGISISDEKGGIIEANTI